MNAEQIGREIEKLETNGEKMINGNDSQTRKILIEQTKALWEIARQLAIGSAPVDRLIITKPLKVKVKP